MGFNIELTDMTEELIEQFKENKAAALEAVGQQIETYAKNNIREAGRIDTGRLRNSITHVTSTHQGESIRFKTEKDGTVLVDRAVTISINDDDKVVVGSAVQYAPYHEYGTGIYASGGRKTPWKYRIRDRKTGQWTSAWTRGLKPVRFLKNAVEQHKDTLRSIVDKYMHGEY